MAGRTLYFCNKGDRSCWPVRNVIGQPVPVDVTKKSTPYRNQFQSSIKLPMATAVGSILQGEVVLPGLVAPLEGTLSTGGTTMSVTPTMSVQSDEVSAEPLRQDPLNYTHWEVTVVEADFWTAAKMNISIDEYPDGFSNAPPSWWEDPTPDVVA